MASTRYNNLSDFGWNVMMAWHFIVFPFELLWMALSYIHNPTMKMIYIYWTNLTMWGPYGVYWFIWLCILISLLVGTATQTKDYWLLLGYTVVAGATGYFQFKLFPGVTEWYYTNRLEAWVTVDDNTPMPENPSDGFDPNALD